MRNRFESQLIELNDSLITMSTYVEESIALATKALKEQDIALAKKVIELESEVDQMEKDIETLCLKMLLQQQPVAKDLRTISAALKMITDLERISDQCADISELAILLSKEQYIKKLEHIPMMAEGAVKMVTDSINAYVHKDLELAQKVIADDDYVDDLFDCVKKDLVVLIRDDIQKSSQAIDLLMIAKYYERIGDHATNIAEWVVFSITGQHKSSQIV